VVAAEVVGEIAILQQQACGLPVTTMASGDRFEV
jgi:hypothetical protein